MYTFAAFDAVDHILLWQKLYFSGVSSKIIRVLKHLYDNASVQVRVGGHYTKAFDIACGVLQGESLSPFLFSLFVSDIEDFFRGRGFVGVNIDGQHDLLMLSFADDLVIVSDSPSDLQKKINSLSDYTRRNKLIVNDKKTKVVCFKRSPRPVGGLSFYFEGKKLETVSSYDYLGVQFSSSCCFLGMTKQIVGRAAASTSSILSLMAKSRIVSWDARVRLYESVVLGAVRHCMPISSLRYQNLLERVQVRFFKSLLHLLRSTPDNAVRIESGVLPISYLMFKSTLNWLEKILDMDRRRIPRLCFDRLRELSNTDPRWNWTLQVRGWFVEIQALSIWERLDAASLKAHKSELLSRYSAFLHSKDVAGLNASSFLLFSQSLVKNPCTIPSRYLTWSLPIYVVRIMAQLRLAACEIIKFTYKGEAFLISATVTCTICNLHRNETLQHIFTECPIYSPIRTQFISRLNFNGPVDPFSRLTLKEVKLVSAFVVQMLKIRAFIMNE